MSAWPTSRLVAMTALLTLLACNHGKDTGDGKTSPGAGDRSLRAFMSCSDVRDYLGDVMLETALSY